MNPTDLIALARENSEGALIVFMIVSFWAFATKRVVFGWQYNQEREEKQRWQQVALSSSGVSAKLIDVKTGGGQT
jgi:hypothetical protein